MSASDRVLLPASPSPFHYAIHLRPNIATFTFSGSQTIALTATSASSSIRLHSRDIAIDIETVTLTPKDGSSSAFKPCAITYDRDGGSFVELRFKAEYPAGEYALFMNFTGELNDKMAGFYRSSYTVGTTPKTMLCTQFEAIDARRAFPCWDEPARKAVFALTVTVDKHLDVVANTPVARRVVDSTDAEKQVVEFLETPKMSTYLLALVIGEFEFVQAVTKTGVLVRVMSVQGKAEKCRFALGVAVRALEFLEDFFGVAFPLPKMDMIAVPDFAAGAMENWGIVTYREVDLLCDEAKVSTSQKQRVASVITHELSHQWFGNLVTMQWWDDLWLNEGFANMMQSLVADALVPEWNMWEQVVQTSQAAALKLDALRSSHPIQVPIPRAEDVEEVFDLISYCKGGSVVRMLWGAVVGPEEFKAGLQRYMKKHAYGNVVTNDLWASFADLRDGTPVADVLGTWTSQMGYPVVTAALDGDTLKLEQRWFLSDGEVPKEEKLWTIPIIVGTEKGGKMDTVFMSGKTCEIKVPDAANCGWIKVNFNQFIPMRVNYDKPMMDRLSSGASDLPPLDQIGLVQDVSALVKAGLVPISQLLPLLSGLSASRNDNVWSAISAAIGPVSTILKAMDKKKDLDAFVLRLISSALMEVGWEPQASDDDNRKQLRAVILSLLAAHIGDDDSHNATVHALFEKFLEDHESVPMDLLGPILRMSVTTDESAWQKLKDVAEKPNLDSAVQRSVYLSMGHVKSEKLKTATMDWCLEPAVRIQDIMMPMAPVGSSTAGSTDLAWKWFQENAKNVMARLGSSSASLVNSVVKFCGSGGCSVAKAKEIEEYFATPASKEMFPSVGRAVSQMVEEMRANGAFLAREQELLGNGELDKALKL